MKNRPRFRPALQPLEDRWCPALSLHFAGGSLTITGTPVSQSTTPATGLLVQHQATGGWRVTDNGVNFGTYAVTGNINVQLTHFNTDVGVDVNGGTLTGNVLFDVGLGDTDPTTANPVSVYDSTATSGTGTNGVNGSVTFRNGSGLEIFSVGSADGLITPAPIRVGGNVFATGRVGISGISGIGNLGDTLFVAPGSQVAGSVYATQIDNVTVLADPSLIFTNSQVAKDVIANDSGSPTGLFVTVSGNVGGNVTAVGTAAPLAGLSAGDQFTQDATSTIGGNVTAAMGDGFNGYSLSGTINGNASLIGSGGSTNNANLLGTINGAAQLTFGNGANVLAYSGSVGGNLTYYGGNGGNDLSAFTGTTGGNITITVGNGTNTFTFGPGATAGDRVDYNGGSGLDSVTINGTNSFALRVNLGAGADTFTYAAGTSVGSATIDFGVDFDTDVYNDNGVVVTWPQTLLNFP